jgi:CyaY protein
MSITDKTPAMSPAPPMPESDFHARVDAILAAIEAAADDTDDIDSELSSGILTLTFDNASKIIVNRQTPNREIWVAAKSGGFHFRFTNGVWVDTRTGEPLTTLLSRVMAQQRAERQGAVINITFD